MRRSTKPCDKAVERRKVCLYLGDIIEEVKVVAEKLGLPVSRLLVHAWQMAKREIAELPASPVRRLPKRAEKEEG